jgi:hypothetical protein
MSRDRIEFDAGGSQPDTLAACRAVAAQAGWTVKSEEPGRIVLKQGWELSTKMLTQPTRFGANPITLDVSLSAGAAGGTRVRLDGNALGFGPIQKHMLLQAMNTLQSGVQAALAGGAPPGAAPAAAGASDEWDTDTDEIWNRPEP